MRVANSVDRQVSQRGSGGASEASKGGLTHEARRYCHGDGEWSNWQACTEQQALDWRSSDQKFEVRKRVTPRQK